MTWVNAVLQGVFLGGAYALTAVGLSLMFGVMRMVNLAHGDLAVCGTYLATTVMAAFGVPLWIAMLIMERENRYVRFHAFQSTIVFGALCVVWVLGTAIPIFGWIVSFLIIPPVSVLVWLLMLFKAYQGERYKLPVAGDIAEQRA